MKSIIAIALLLIVGQACAEQIEQVISVQHDSHRGVTCWILNNTGISCLPDGKLQPHGTSTIDQQLEAPTPASTPTPRGDGDTERFRL